MGILLMDLSSRGPTVMTEDELLPESHRSVVAFVVVNKKVWSSDDLAENRVVISPVDTAYPGTMWSPGLGEHKHVLEGVFLWFVERPSGPDYPAQYTSPLSCFLFLYGVFELFDVFEEVIDTGLRPALRMVLDT